MCIRDRIATQQIYVNFKCNKLECDIPMIVVDKLTYDCIIGIDVLNKLGAVINLENNSMTCKVKGGLYVIKFEESENNLEEEQEPIVISRPVVNHAASNINMQEDNQHEGMELIEELIQEYQDIFSDVPTITNAYEHKIQVTDPTKFVRRTYPIPMKLSLIHI